MMTVSSQSVHHKIAISTSVFGVNPVPFPDASRIPDGMPARWRKGPFSAAARRAIADVVTLHSEAAIVRSEPRPFIPDVETLSSVAAPVQSQPHTVFPAFAPHFAVIAPEMSEFVPLAAFFSDLSQTHPDSTFIPIEPTERLMV
jgi:hypothetical protein